MWGELGAVPFDALRLLREGSSGTRSTSYSNPGLTSEANICRPFEAGLQRFRLVSSLPESGSDAQLNATLERRPQE